jgi:hypothetical protein
LVQGSHSFLARDAANPPATVRLSRWLAKDREVGEVLRLVSALEIEGQQGFLVAKAFTEKELTMELGTNTEMTSPMSGANWRKSTRSTKSKMGSPLPPNISIKLDKCNLQGNLF